MRPERNQADQWVLTLGMSRDSRPLRIRGRVPEQEDTDLSTLFNHDRFNIELALNRVAVLFSQAGIRAVHLRETLSSLLVPRGWIVAPRNVLVRQMFEARVQSLINQITLGPLSTPAMARSCFVFDGLKLVTSIEQNTELVLAKAKSVRVSNGEFRCFAKIATDDVEIAIAAPSVGYLTFSACQAASIRLVILDHDHGVFLQKDRSVEYCRKHDIAVFGYARFGEGSGR